MYQRNTKLYASDCIETRVYFSYVIQIYCLALVDRWPLAYVRELTSYAIYSWCVSFSACQRRMTSPSSYFRLLLYEEAMMLGARYIRIQCVWQTFGSSVRGSEAIEFGFICFFFGPLNDLTEKHVNHMHNCYQKKLPNHQCQWQKIWRY